MFIFHSMFSIIFVYCYDLLFFISCCHSDFPLLQAEQQLGNSGCSGKAALGKGALNVSRRLFFYRTLGTHP